MDRKTQKSRKYVLSKYIKDRCKNKYQNTLRVTHICHFLFPKVLFVRVICDKEPGFCIIVQTFNVWKTNLPWCKILKNKLVLLLAYWLLISGLPMPKICFEIQNTEENRYDRRRFYRMERRLTQANSYCCSDFSHHDFMCQQLKMTWTISQAIWP